MTYEPFIDDLEHIRAVDRQRFVVLRPNAFLTQLHKRLQELLRERFGDESISYAAQAHVTLGGFAAGTDLREVQDLVESWSLTVAPLRITVEAVACVPTPHQIVILRVAKTPELLAAVSQLQSSANRANLKIDATISPLDWVFHMSVGYCTHLNGSAWNDVETFVDEWKVSGASCVVNDVEVAAFDDEREYSGGVYALRGTTSAAAEVAVLVTHRLIGVPISAGIIRRGTSRHCASAARPYMLSGITWTPHPSLRFYCRSSAN
jgi:hypothetical protein